MSVIVVVALVLLAVLSIAGSSLVQLASVGGMAVARWRTREASFGRRATALLAGGLGASLLAELVHVVWHLVRQDQPGHLGFWFSAVAVGLINVGVMLAVAGAGHWWARAR